MFTNRKATMALSMNTLAFTVCFACWMLNGVLVTFLIENQIFAWSDSQIGWVIGIPVLSGALFRLPAGILTDKYGGKYVFSAVMLLAAIPMYLLSFADSYWSFFLCSLAFGIVGSSFAVGIAYTAVWFKPENQGTALGVFGAGNAGAALTSMGAPFLLAWLTKGGENIDAWRAIPRFYAGILLLMTVVFWLGTTHKKADDSHINSLRERLAPLRHLRVWRFGLYYFLLFGGFVALAQWLIPYYVNAYMMPLAMAGLMAAIFSLPSGIIRALGGYMSDRMGARRVMYGVLGTCLVACALLIVPRMAVESPGKGIMAKRSGTVTKITADALVVDDMRYALRVTDEKALRDARESEAFLVLPSIGMEQKPVVKVGDVVEKKQLLAQGTTKIYFQANVWIFTAIVFVIGIAMGIGKAAVYKHIPDYFPNEVGVVGGIVGGLGGLGGFVCPITFGMLLEQTGIWTTCWIFFTLLTGVCLWWMHHVIQRMHSKSAPALKGRIESTECYPENPDILGNPQPVLTSLHGAVRGLTRPEHRELFSFARNLKCPSDSTEDTLTGVAVPALPGDSRFSSLTTGQPRTFE